MKILHISTRLILGGSQENTVLSCEGQARRGHDVHLAFGPIYGPEGSLLDRVKAFRAQDGRAITTHVVPHLVRAVSPLADRRARHELESLIRGLKPDIVHTHSSKAGILGRVAAWNSRGGRHPGLQILGSHTKSHFAGGERGAVVDAIPLGIVHTIHGPPFMPVDGSFSDRARIRINNWLYTRAERYAATRCDVIVAVADAMTRQFLERGIGRPEQYVRVRSGMEIEPFLNAAPGQSREDVRAALGLARGDFVVGTVARLAQHKGHDDLLDALGEELKRTPRLKLLWIGDGWWRERLIARARGLGVSVAELDGSNGATASANAQLILTGLARPTRIPGLIRAMDLLAHPSYREGLPRTVPQALLCGVCPVAYDCDGTGEVLRDGQTGRLVPVGDRTKLREAIVWLKEHAAERRAMADRGRAECAEVFSAERMVAELEDVYARALSGQDKRVGMADGSDSARLGEPGDLQSRRSQLGRS